MGGTLSALTTAGLPVLAASVRAELWRGAHRQRRAEAAARVRSTSHSAAGAPRAWTSSPGSWSTSVVDGTPSPPGIGPASCPTARAAVHTQRLRLAGDGAVWFDDEVVVPDAWDERPQVGLSFLAPADLGDVAWFGLGPGENETDRCSGSVVGHFGGVPDELPYLMPQDFGTRTGVRWYDLVGR